jgi:hypothetical protein
MRIHDHRHPPRPLPLRLIRIKLEFPDIQRKVDRIRCQLRDLISSGRDTSSRTTHHLHIQVLLQVDFQSVPFDDASRFGFQAFQDVCRGIPLERDRGDGCFPAELGEVEGRGVWR